MRTIWQSLAWKEWHEHKWAAVSIAAILAAVTALIALSVDDQSILVAIQANLFICAIPLAIFVGLGTAAGERSRGTLPFLQALPIPLWRVALHKLVAGLLTAVLPFMFVAAAAFAIFRLLLHGGVLAPRALNAASMDLGTGSWLLDTAILLSYLTGSFFLWTIATGVNRRDEVHAGGVALASMVGWGVILTLAWMCLLPASVPPAAAPREWSQRLAVIGLSTMPGGLIPVLQMAQAPRNSGQLYDIGLLALCLTIATISHLALAWNYVNRFGRMSNSEINSPETARVASTRHQWLGPPRRSEFTAVVWKQFRESGPLALAGLAGIVLMFAFFLFSEWRHFSIHRQHVVELIAGVTGAAGLVIAMVLGVGQFRTDIRPGINAFWRSRPINPDLWFWTKFGSGLVIALTTIYLPLVLIAGRDAASTHPDLQVIRLAHLAVFAAAVAMICLVRQAVYAAILSIAVVYLGLVAVSIVLGVYRFAYLDQRFEGIGDLFKLNESQVAAGMYLSFVTSTLLAWLAVRYDWGQKSVR